MHDKLDVKHRKYCLNTENVNFYSIIQKGASNKSFLSLNISHSYRNYALPHMTPTYPENIRLIGPSSWEEIESQQTDVQTDRPQEFPSLLTCLRIIHAILFCQFFIPSPRPSASGLIISRAKPGSFQALLIFIGKSNFISYALLFFLLIKSRPKSSSRKNVAI